MTLMPYEIPPRSLPELHADIRKDGGHVHDAARQAYERITGLRLPNPGEHVTWWSDRLGESLTGTVDEVVFYGGRFEVRIDGDRREGDTHRVRHSIDISDLNQPSPVGGA